MIRRIIAPEMLEPLRVSTFDRNAYMRDYMKAYRKANHAKVSEWDRRKNAKRRVRNG